MTSVGLVLSAGLIAGAAHVISGPDHLAAVLPLAVASPVRAMKAGAVWGLGHGIGVCLLLAAGQILRSSVDIKGVSSWAEIVVGLMLIGLGVRGMLGGHPHRHHHDAQQLHRQTRVIPSEVGIQGRIPSALGFGVVHGVAGGSHLMAAVPTVVVGGGLTLGYAAAYLVGCVAVMAGFAAGVGRVLKSEQHQMTAIFWTGLVAAVVGIFWVGMGVVKI